MKKPVVKLIGQDGNAFAMTHAIFLTALSLLVATCGVCLQGCEQETTNPHTDSCDLVQRNSTGPVQVVCTVVTRIR